MIYIYIYNYIIYYIFWKLYYIFIILYCIILFYIILHYIISYYIIYYILFYSILFFSILLYYILYIIYFILYIIYYLFIILYYIYMCVCSRRRQAQLSNVPTHITNSHSVYFFVLLLDFIWGWYAAQTQSGAKVTSCSSIWVAVFIHDYRLIMRYICIYIYKYICILFNVYIYIYIYIVRVNIHCLIIYIYIYVCVCVCAYVLKIHIWRNVEPWLYPGQGEETKLQVTKADGTKAEVVVKTLGILGIGGARTIWRFPIRGEPPVIIHLRICQYQNHPFWGIPIVGNLPFRDSRGLI